VTDLLRPLWLRSTPADGYERTAATAARHGLRPAGGTTFPGHGQGRRPGRWISAIRAGVLPWVESAEADDVCRRLAELPDQDVPRPDPLYRVAAFSAG
jgi:hypothetical protein